MIESIIYGLSNDQYHRGELEREYLSSSQLKWYRKSPRYAKHMLDALTYRDATVVCNNSAVINIAEGKSDALHFGSLFHSYIECAAKRVNNDPDTIEELWMQQLAVFTPPLNESKGQPYGSTTKAYAAAYESFLKANGNKLIASQNEIDTVKAMVRSLMYESGATSEQVKKLLNWGKPEVSHFIEYEGCKFKWRPDLESPRKIVDWKTVATDDLSEESINRIILKYDYHISSAMYQFFTHEQSGVWKQFILALVSKVPPYDSVMVDMANYGYRYYLEDDFVSMGPGAMEFKELLDLHIKCTKENHWPGAENAIPEDNGVRIMEIMPPRYYSNRFIEEI